MMKSTYFEPQIELVRFDCADIVATSGIVSFTGFNMKPINAPSGDTSTVESAELDTF